MGNNNVKFDKEFWLLLILFLSLLLSIILRVNAEATNYQSPDSFFYLKVAENILKGKGFAGPTSFPFNQESVESYFAIWPAGYPCLIALFGLVIPNLLWASKAVNLFFLGASFVLLYIQYKQSAIWASFAYFSYGLTEVYSYTWSEGPFLFFVLLLFYGLNQEQEKKQLFHVGLSLTCLFLLRYAGIIFWLFILGYMIYQYTRKEYVDARRLLVSLMISGLFIVGYLAINYIKTGFMTGAERVYIGLESWTDFTYYLFRGLLNVFAFARNLWFVGNKDSFAIGLLLLQILVIIFVYRGVKFNLDLGQRLMVFSAGFYFVMIIILRSISPFDSFNYRILSPVSLILFIVFFQSILKNIEGKKYQKLALYSFVFISFLINLPVYFLLEEIKILR
ncbi:hypothetical protein [Shivajiella indica]|uniref:Glycosyltransferase RgtA/B/C/D-like domain-containing protein n=1 Tax=Shivajiella indica TaxID=872115 RepID=A0ABW5BDH4_9BACT